MKYDPTWENLRIADHVIVVEISTDDNDKVEHIEIYDSRTAEDISWDKLLELTEKK